MKCLVLALIAIIGISSVMAAPAESEATCSPMYQNCQVTDQCCRYLICSHYQAMCIPKGGLINPGEDKRPLGPGPYPPNVPKELLP